MAKETSRLPAYTTIENMLFLLDIFRNKNGDEETSKPLFGKTSSYGVTKSALRSFKLIMEDSCQLAPLGKIISYSNEIQKKGEVFKLVVSYSPYESLLMNIFRENETETETSEMVNFWGRFDKGSTPRNLEDAARLFGTIVEYIELGKFKKGSRGKASRIIWVNEAKQKFEEALSSNNLQTTGLEGIDNEAIETVETPNEEPIEENTEVEEQPANVKGNEVAIGKTPSIITKATYAPNITINVDMSDWTDEKIKSFFKYAYGIFDEDEEQKEEE